MKALFSRMREHTGRHMHVATCVVLAIVVGLGSFSFYRATSPPSEIIPAPAADSIGSTAPILVAREAMPKSGPSRLRIPKLDIDVAFSEPLGLAKSGEIEVPKEYDKVGWYEYGPMPGSLGPAVVLGHVDSKAGPAVFFYLGQLAVGDSIFVEREDGSAAEFVVSGLERYPQNEFPTEKVYGNIDHAGLRLVTCSGTYQKGEMRYTHNLVVYAALKNAL